MYLDVVRSVRMRKQLSDLRLEEAVSPFELLVLIPHYLHAVDDLHQTCLELLGLSVGLVSRVTPDAVS